jgi:hypothetical protein
MTAPGPPDRLPIVEVEWVDSAGHDGWRDQAEAADLLPRLGCRVAGYLVHDEPEGIVVALGIGGHGQYLAAMGIPRAAITKLTRPPAKP